MVNELLILLQGVNMKMRKQDGSIVIKRVRACMGMISSDLPATKNLAGSMSFNSKSQDETRRASRAWRNAKTKQARIDLEQRSGVRFTILLKLPYFSYDIIAIEPMHALYLGVVKIALKQMLCPDTFSTLQKILPYIRFHSDATSSILTNRVVKEGFSRVKAAEHKKFITSTAHAALLPPTLQASVYNHLIELVHALRILNSSYIKITDINVTLNHLLNFAKQYEAKQSFPYDYT
ncbi:hypothetical protein A0J61_09572 [Choanephora cucurbitarum]|uniref:Uncharacterized protein n=1 Tax=Choanephora cucurbitarum TaxID=101091 RepID=A0A1C7N029_9FUNG|nr:hypothetical protein A0J61_09572 [Choanephora cucurbitarum]